MHLARRMSLVVLPATVAVVVLLVVLATLQYRWAGELSQAEGARLRAGARARAEAFSRELDVEITRAFLALSPPPEALRSRDFSAFAGQLDAWRRAALQPGLVRDLYLVEKSEDGLGISRWLADSRTFVPSEWPAGPGTGALRAAAEAMLRGPGPGPGRRGPPDLIVDEVPALLSWVFDREARRDGPPGTARADGPRPGGSESGPGRFRPLALMVMVLDVDALLPLLASRHFAGPAGLDSDLQVVRQRDRSRTVWQLRPAITTGAHAPDAVAGLLDLRFEDVPNPGRGPGDRGPGARGRAHTEDTGDWRLLVFNRGGALDDVVAAARRRNLAVSFGILLLLGVATALVIAASELARSVGNRQMAFVAAVSHELRTPAAVICSTAENLADGVVRDPAQVRVYGRILLDEGRRLGDMVEGVLAFAGASVASASTAQAEVPVGALLEQALEPFRLTLAERGFTLVQDVALGLPPLRGDALALRRMVQNLVENALKYDSGGCWLALRATTGTGNRDVRIIVEDHGRGIDARDLRQVFEPFFRGRAALEAQIHGFGLGLAFVHRVALNHGGRVQVESVPGTGSVFTIHLPAAPVTEAAAELEAGDAVTHPRR